MEGKSSNIKSGNNKETTKKKRKKYFKRLRASERMQHIIFVVCFLVLVITGFIVKTPEEVAIVLGKTGEKAYLLRGILHRIAAIVYIMTGLYLSYQTLFKPVSRRRFTNLIPKLGDFKDLIATYLYYLGIKDKPSKFGKFNYMNKFKHITFIIGSIILIVTGVILWTEYLWSTFVINAVIIVHSMQAILMCLIIALNLVGRSLKEKKKFPLNSESANRF